MRAAYSCFGGVFCLFVVGFFFAGVGGWVYMYQINQSIKVRREGKEWEIKERGNETNTGEWRNDWSPLRS